MATMMRSAEERTMNKAAAITCLFLDIGGVLLTDGWDHHARRRAATNFKLNLAEMEDRHHLTFDTYEEGKLTLEEGLGIRSILHKDYSSTCEKLASFGLQNDDGVTHETR